MKISWCKLFSLDTTLSLKERQLLGATISGQSYSNELAEEVLRGNHELSHDLLRLVREELHIGVGDLCVLGAWEQQSRREVVVSSLL